MPSVQHNLDEDARGGVEGQLPSARRSPRVLFIIPLVGKHNCHCWTSVCKRLQSTLDCISNQTSPNWHVFIVCNEPPNVRIDPAKTTVLTCDLPLQSGRPGARSLDKEKKLQFGMIHARAVHPEFIMFLDGDDRVSNRLVAFVDQHKELDGFLITRGYLYRLGSRWLVTLHRFHLSCGSCYLFRYREAEAPTSMEQLRTDFWMVKAHNKSAREHFEKHQYRYLEVPFPAAIYLRGHGDSIRVKFALFEKDTIRARISLLRDEARRFARFLLRSVYLRDSIESEFGPLR